MKRLIKNIAVTLVLSITAFSQESKTVNADMVWLGYFNTIRLNSKFSINSDLQARTRNNLLSQYVTRSGIVYGISSKIFVTVGFAGFFYPQATNQNLIRNEWRPWEELMHSDNLGKLKVNHRIRFEQRHNEIVAKNNLTDDYNYTNRFRYKIDLQYPLFRNDTDSHAVYLLVSNEVMLNTSKSVKSNYFDQNRTAFGVNYRVNSSLTFQIQLMNIWQLQSGGTMLEQDKVLRFNFYHTINGSRSTK